jgi:hypothetical protein
MYHYGINHANKTPLRNTRCFYVLYMYQVKACFAQGFPRLKALAKNCQPTVRWVGLTEKYQSGIKFLFNIKFLSAIGYAPLVMGLRHSVRFRQKTCGMAWVRFISLLRNLGIIFYSQSRVAYFASLVVLREVGWVVLRPSAAELRRCGMDAAVS